MEVEVSFEVGNECFYRDRTYGPFERVKIIEIYRAKQSFRRDIEFLDDELVGVSKTVLSHRLRGLCSEVKAFDRLMANWRHSGNSKSRKWKSEALKSYLIFSFPSRLQRGNGILLSSRRRFMMQRHLDHSPALQNLNSSLIFPGLSSMASWCFLLKELF